jgi:inactivated superfamily I helicase
MLDEGYFPLRRHAIDKASSATPLPRNSETRDGRLTHIATLHSELVASISTVQSIKQPCENAGCWVKTCLNSSSDKELLQHLQRHDHRQTHQEELRCS